MHTVEPWGEVAHTPIQKGGNRIAGTKPSVYQTTHRSRCDVTPPCPFVYRVSTTMRARVATSSRSPRPNGNSVGARLQRTARSEVSSLRRSVRRGPKTM